MPPAFPRTIPVRLTASGLINTDLDCPGCGYNLRMQKARGTCPECGSAIDLVERNEADRLAHAAPAWRARIARGTRWLHRSVILAPAGLLPGLVAAAAALWLLTTPEPDRPEARAARSVRRSARWASVTAAAAGLAAVGVGLTQHGNALAAALRPGGGPAGISPVLKLQRALAAVSDGWDALDLLLSLAAASMAVALLQTWRHLFSLAARADDPAAARRCRQTWRGYLVGGGLLVALALATSLGHRLGLGLPDRWYEWTVVVLLAAVALVLLWIWWVTLRLTRGLVRALAPP